MANMLISVIVPIYKVENCLEKCVRSIVEQTYTDLEIILVDDGSPDGCGAMCDAWAVRDSRIKVIHKENGGLSDARNAGLAIATGSLISFIDSDDWIEPDFLESLVVALEHQEAQIAECAVKFVDEGGNVLRLRQTANVPCIDKLEGLCRLVKEDGIYQTVWNKLYRREVLEGILFEKGKCHEDEFWTYRVFDRMERLAIVERPMYYYLQRSGSIMGTGYSLKRLDCLEALSRRMKYLSKYDELRDLTRQQLILELLWHLQSSLRHLQGEERKTAVTAIMKLKKATPKVPNKKLTLNAKYRIWYKMFTTAPILTARVRNLLKIGV
jgi:glycosyltransferase involved in cell wall biosynthesis